MKTTYKTYVVIAALVAATAAFAGVKDLYQAAVIATPQTTCGSFEGVNTKEFEQVAVCLENAAKVCQAKTATFGDHTAFSLSKDPTFGCMLNIEDKGIHGETEKSGKLEVSCSTAQLERLKGIYQEMGNTTNLLEAAIEGVDYACGSTMNGIVQQTVGQSLSKLRQYEKSLYIERDNVHNTIAAQLQNADASQTFGIKNKYGSYIGIYTPQLEVGQKVLTAQSNLVAIQDNIREEINIWKYNMDTKQFNKDFGKVSYDCGDVAITTPYISIEMNHKHYICAEDQPFNPMQLIVNDINQGQITTQEGSPIMKKSRIEIDWKSQWAQAFNSREVGVPLRINNQGAQAIKTGIEWK